ncbi:MAG: MBL fold metallo-hydrolase [Desulfobacterales bacterium]|nr:MBL fold metallo-hydrolase [Desulfobacterales bacterium]
MRKTVKWILPILGLALLVSFMACASKAPFTEEDWAAQVEATSEDAFYGPHGKGGRYFAPWMEMPSRNFIQVLRWRFLTPSNYTEEEETYLPRVLADAPGRLTLTRGDFILWIGHNTFLIRVGDEYWVTDPMFSDRALVPERKTPPALTLSEFVTLFPRVNILISHNHYDHLDRASIRNMAPDCPVYVPLGLKGLLGEMNKEVVTEMDWWQEMDLGGGNRLVCLPAQHWSMRVGQGKNRSLWASWLLITPEKQFYFGGDTGYFKGFREIGKRYPGIDYAFMATTAYHPRWFMHYQHMNIPEAVQGFDELGAKVFIPTQWGTFHLGSEPAGYPALDLKRYLEAEKRDPGPFKIMDIGEILNIP